MDWFSDMAWLFLEWIIWILGAGAFALLGGWLIWYRPYRAERTRMSSTIAELQAERSQLKSRLEDAERRVVATGT